MTKFRRFVARIHSTELRVPNQLATVRACLFRNTPAGVVINSQPCALYAAVAESGYFAVAVLVVSSRASLKRGLSPHLLVSLHRHNVPYAHSSRRCKAIDTRRCSGTFEAQGTRATGHLHSAPIL